MDLAGATVIFDLDGTLVDSAPDLVRAANEAMAEVGFPPMPLEDVRAMVGRGGRALLRRAYAHSGAGAPEPVMEARLARFLELYEGDIARLTRFYPGALETLGRLKEAGARLVIATNKSDHLTATLLAALGAEAWFERVVGATSAPRRKPDASHLLAAAGSPAALARAVMVGDSGTDVAAARAAGAPVVVMAHGYSETPLDALGADAVVDGFAELPATVAALLRK
ncbi:MAG: HAD-IA family hydrolase [Caulobacterales bacterium]|nr:HAD-IA family hydrolase [Caulobacterales bacterium]